MTGASPRPVVSLREVLRDLPVLTANQSPGLDGDKLPVDPAELFADWLTAAISAGVDEPHAMTLATCDAAGRPDSRVLLLKDLDEVGWWFATSSTSAKGLQLRNQPTAALCFYWPAQGRQVRVRGTVTTTQAERSAADFHARGLGSRAAALGSRTSTPLSSRAECDEAVTDARNRLEHDPTLTSPTWTAYAVVAETVEFWQADPARRHHRALYRRAAGDWEHGLLWP